MKTSTMKIWWFIGMITSLLIVFYTLYKWYLDGFPFDNKSDLDPNPTRQPGYVFFIALGLFSYINCWFNFNGKEADDA
jgi:hypothetical protein